ncbi:serine hydrolase [Variovorax sp. J22R115]|uniref:serine hydrolase domain-containing protein n=1 Tax=Variovorax sp. J22R115 TaxID=3053509 RepID=UPI002574B35C|nr:serine hydrolase [Variovorax sp. J22R115]MDM0049973.1 serine hydrolase [Variovorax sp. J22R115]
MAQESTPLPVANAETVGTASETDPRANGLMRGSPPPEDKRVVLSNALEFPQLRWSASHWRELAPTQRVSRGTGAAAPLPRNERDLSGVRIRTLTGADMRFPEALEATYLDGLVVLHNGSIVFEEYRGEGGPDQPHLCFSVTKSMVGMLAVDLIVQGLIDDRARVTRYVPELDCETFGDATVRNILDMTIAARWSENYADPAAEIRSYGVPSGLRERSADYTGPTHLADYLPNAMQRNGEHGKAFVYITPLSDVLAWIVVRASGKPLSQLLSERVWAPMGAEHDAYFNVDSVGAAVAGVGFSCALRDMARVGELLRCRGSLMGQRVFDPQVCDALFQPASAQEKAVFAAGAFASLKEWSYRNQWWMTNNASGAITARGIYGQALYIDPKAEVVIARFASMPTASNLANDHISLPLYQAIADALA